MEINDLKKLPVRSQLPTSTSELGIEVILPGDTLADTQVGEGKTASYQPGIVPIGLAQIQQMCDLDEATLALIQAEIEPFLLAHAQKTIERVNDRGQEVYDEWGLLNPENLFVLLSLLSQIARFHKKDYAEQTEKIRILTLGTASGMTDMAMYRLLKHFDVDFEIHTVDFRKDEHGKRTETELLVPLDKRNACYGPVPERGIGHEIESARRKLGGLDNVIQHHIDSAAFLSAASANSELIGTFHFVFIDANHQFDGALYDLVKSWNLLMPGGVTFLDDFGGSKLATNGGVTMAAYVYAAHSNQFGYYVDNPFDDPFRTNAAFFIDSTETSAGEGSYDLTELLERFNN